MKRRRGLCYGVIRAQHGQDMSDIRIIVIKDHGRYQIHSQSAAGSAPIGDRLRKGTHGEGWPWQFKARPEDYEDPREAFKEAEKLQAYIDACAGAARKRTRQRH